MAEFTERFTEVWYPLASENSDIYTPGTTNGTWVSLANYHRAVLVIIVGDMVATSTLDAGIQQATDTAGTGAAAIAGKTITQLTAAGGDGNDLVAIELRTEELNVTGGFDCVRYYVTVGTANVELGCTLYGGVPRFQPTATTNWTEIVG
jgi:hypothetical protein